MIERKLIVVKSYQFHSLDDLFRRRKIYESKALIAVTSFFNYTKQ
ncbi:MAG: hypothetical protein ACJAYB_001763 [Psychromonas sp.]|jgi:hypothetical protein